MNTENGGKAVTVKRILPVTTIVVGLTLMAIKIIADSEPGARPLLLIVLGAGWLFYVQAYTK